MTEPTITIHVQFNNKRKKLGSGQRFKSEFIKLEKIIEEIKQVFQEDMVQEWAVQLWHTGRGRVRLYIMDDDDLVKTIGAKKEIVIHVEYERSGVASTGSQTRMDILESQVKGVTQTLDRVTQQLGRVTQQLDTLALYVQRNVGVLEGNQQSGSFPFPFPTTSSMNYLAPVPGEHFGASGQSSLNSEYGPLDPQEFRN